MIAIGGGGYVPARILRSASPELNQTVGTEINASTVPS